jgi:Cu-Zn family superoxide dismutase
MLFVLLSNLLNPGWTLTMYANLDVGKSPTLEKNYSGEVWLIQDSAASTTTTLRAKFRGLKPSSSYGLHVHEKCDIENCNLFGGHWDTVSGSPKHGKWNQLRKHVGDLPSCDTDINGECEFSVTMTETLLLGGPGYPNVTNTQGIVLHSMPDDFGTTGTGTSSTTGNAGSRLACGCLAKWAHLLLPSLLLLALAF